VEDLPVVTISDKTYTLNCEQVIKIAEGMPPEAVSGQRMCFLEINGRHRQSSRLDSSIKKRR
jgi:hypothetical protein